MIKIKKKNFTEEKEIVKVEIVKGLIGEWVR